MLLNKKLRHCHSLCHARGPRNQGGFVNAGGWGTRKIAYHFHAAYTRRDKNTRLAWNVSGTYYLTLLPSTLTGTRLTYLYIRNANEHAQVTHKMIKGTYLFFKEEFTPEEFTN